MSSDSVPVRSETGDDQATRHLPPSETPSETPSAAPAAGRSESASEPTRFIAASVPLRVPATPADERLRAAPRSLGGADCDYALIELLGRGGMGAVHAAQQTALDRVVAVKLLHDGADPALRRQLLIEAAVASTLDHPGIVPVHDLGRTADGRLFYAMKRVQGRAWNDVIDDRPLAANLEVLLRVCDAVAYAHSRGVIHRDLKPHNVMLGDYGEVYVLDWGAAAGIAPGAPAPPLEADHPIAGTPAYLAPEQARRDQVAIGVASDIYQLGGLLFRILAGRPPHPGRSTAELLRNAKANHIANVPPLPGAQLGLMAIALGALAAEPELRPASVRDFQDAIRRHQEHAESLAAAARAQQMLDQAASEGGYGSFARALFGFEEAVALWDGNTLAQRRLVETRRAYARHAIAQGDLDLAGSLVSGDDDDLAAAVAAAQGRREAESLAAAALAEEQAARRLLAAQVAADHQRDWHEVLHEDFAAAGLDERWEFVGGDHAAAGGELRLVGGTPQLALLRRPFAGDLRLEFTCRQESAYLNDVSCFLAAADLPDRGKIPGSGYEFKYGGFDNSRTLLYRAGRVLFDRAESPLRRGVDVRVRVERVAGRLTLGIDGAVVFAVDDPQPLDGPGQCRLGLFGWLADTRYRDLRVWQLGAPRTIDLLEAAERHLALGHYTTAGDLYADAEVSSGDPRRRQRASAGRERAERLRGLWQRMPELHARLTAAWPQARVACGLDGVAIDIAGQDIADLAPLAGMPVARLDCSGNRIADLSALAGMPLRRLACADNRIASLAPLAGMPLTVLDCSGNRIADLAPLAGMPLADLRCAGNQIADLAPLAGMPLADLRCSGNRIADLAPLAGAPLAVLECNGNRITDLAPLAGAPLTVLECNGNRIADLAPLAGSRLTRLVCDGNRIADLTPLAGLPLASLECGGNRICDLAPLAGLPLVRLYVSDNPVRDLAPLAGLPLAGLWCAGTAVTSLAPAARLPLTSFEFDGLGLPETALAEVAAWTPPAAAWAADAARLLLARRGDADALRAQAHAHAGRRYLYLPTGCGWDAARALCQRLGGDLACPRDDASHQVVAELIPAGRLAWIGARRAGDGWAWLDGEAIAHPRFARAPNAGDHVLMRSINGNGRWVAGGQLGSRGGCLVEWRE